MRTQFFPQRVVCLTEETTEALYLMGLEDYIVGITQYTVRPKRAKKEKPVVSRFIDAKIDKILDLKPDLVLAWSDLQADIVAELIRAGIQVHCFNHRSLYEIPSMTVQLAAMLGHQSKGEELAEKMWAKIEATKISAEQLSQKPKVYFEEWYDPIITGIRWVSEIIELCGGIDIFAENKFSQGAKGRIVADFLEPARRNPDIILASWCGVKFKKKDLISRENWQEVEAVKNDMIYEIKSEIILQPGPAAIFDGIDIVSSLIKNCTFDEKSK